jgi:phosphate-selective porin OprO/OprP
MARSLFALTALIVLSGRAAFAEDFASDRVIAPAARITLSPKPVEPPATAEPAQVPEVEEQPAVAEPERKGPSIRLRGRLEADSITIDQDLKNKLLYGNFENVVGFRRARLGAEGEVGEQTRWVSEIDFGGGMLALKDAFIAVNKLPILREVRVGHQLEPFSLEGQTRSSWFPFIERSPSYALDPARNWGVAFYSHTADQRIFLQAGAFKSGTDNTGTDVGDGNDMAYTARFVLLPVYEESDDSLELVHIGGAASQRYPKNDEVTFNQGPQSSLLQFVDNPLTPFVPNISIPANQNQVYNLQAALVLGCLSFQTEWNGSRVEQIGGGPVFLHGGYVLASYFLTGEHRGYNREFGAFGETRVRRPFICMENSEDVGSGPGAWELTARWAYLNFDSPNLATDANGLKIGDRVTAWTVGLNWYLTDNTRIMLNYVYAIPVDPNFGSSTANVFTIRTSIVW